MGQRSRVSPIQVRGPWRGLDTSRSLRELGPQDAAVAENVLFRDGAITPRPPFRLEDGPLGGQVVFAGVSWPPATPLPGKKSLRVYHVDDRLTGEGADGIDGVNRRPGTFVRANGRLFYFDGVRGYVLIEVEGQRKWFRLGIPAPTVGRWITGQPYPTTSIIWYVAFTGNAIAGELIQSRVYQFAFSWYDVSTGMESNATVSEELQIPVQGGAHYYLAFYAAPPPSGYLGSYVRVYRRDVTAGQPFLLLAEQTHLTTPDVLHNVQLAPVGNTEVGPFAPVKNGLPERASVALFYKGRMLYNDLDHPNLLRFSADSQPGHVDPMDYLELNDDGGQITGMAEYSGQAVIIKERPIWILSGVIISPTNTSIALGASVVPSAHDLYRTKATTGCANAAGGNGAIVCGSPPLVYYNGFDGLYAFDGSNSAPAGKRIRPTWVKYLGAFTEGANQAVSYFHDAACRIVYMLNFAEKDAQRVKVLAYHYEIGAWATVEIGIDDLPYTPTWADPRKINATCLMPFIGSRFPEGPGAWGESRGLSDDADYESEELTHVGMTVAVSIPAGPAGVPSWSFVVLALSELLNRLPMPAFLYQTGAMQVIDGIDKHFYAVKWHHGQAAGDDGLDHNVAVGYRTGPNGSVQEKVIGLTRDSSTYHAVSESGQDITLSVRGGGGDSRWSPDVRIVGYEIDAEIVGQR